jgi:biopolymer transport protein ExbB
METAPTPEQLNTIQWFAKFMIEGGIFMWIILAVWIFGIVVSIDRLRKFKQIDTDAKALMDDIQKHVLLNEVGLAIEKCSNNKSILSLVLRNGLKRANQSKDKIMDALEASILEVIPEAEKKLPAINLTANISTLLGLLGTIQGLIQSFAAVANAEPSEKAQLLAQGIATAMNTTALGLVSAISILVVYSYLTSKSEKMIGEVQEYSLKLVDLLNARKPQQNDKAA